jgi:glycosyltransferase involved in cell wall biosynthesis
VTELTPSASNEKRASWFARASRRPLVLDVTAVSSAKNFTGVQRMVMEFATAHVRDVLLVRFDQRSSTFRVVKSVSSRRPRQQPAFITRFRKRALRYYLRSSKKWSERVRGTLFEDALRRLGEVVYHAFLSEDVPDTRSVGLRAWPEWEAGNHQNFVLIDIPTNRSHRDALVDLFESHEVITVVYLHDLFPLSHRRIIAPKARVGVRANHLRYLDIVSQADRVVCNSNFTRRQYEKFTKLLEDDSVEQAIRVVYPPWPRFTSTRGQSPDSSKPSGNSLNVLAVGALDRRKNLAVLLRALAALEDYEVMMNLVIVAQNDEEMSEEFAQDYASLSKGQRRRIHLIREKITDKDLSKLYVDADVIAVPSLAEGFGLPVTEAIASGKPVAVARTTALAELSKILPIEVANPHDEQEWARALLAARERTQDIVSFDRPKQIPADWADFKNRMMAAGRYKIS